jgi:predicted nucleic acid-binding Zn ribbon protein
MKIRITPAHGYVHGHIETLLIRQGITPPARRPDGIVELDMSEAQIAAFRLTGNAHKIERLADSEAPAPVAEAPAPPPAPAPAADSPFVALTCPVCANEFNLVKAMLPGGSSVVMNCSKCGAQLTVEHAEKQFEIVDALKRIPAALERIDHGLGDRASRDQLVPPQDEFPK